MTEEIAKPNRKMGVHQMKGAEFSRQDWIVYPEAGTPLDEMLVPQYWASVARLVKQWDRIEVRPADGSWWAELIVLVVEPFAVKVDALRFKAFAPREPALTAEVPDGYEVKYRGNARWCVRRLIDGEVLFKDGKSQPEAALWLDRHLKVLAA